MSITHAWSSANFRFFVNKTTARVKNREKVSERKKISVQRRIEEFVQEGGRGVKNDLRSRGF